MAVRFIGPYRASFPLGPLQNVFTGPDRFSVESARDAYALANPSWLAQYDANRTLNIRLEYSDNDAGVAVYQIRNSTSDGWIDNSSARGITGKGVSFDNLPTGALPAVGSTPDKEAVDSGGRLLEDGMTFFDSLGVGSESIDVGKEVVLSDQAGAVGFSRNSDGLSRFIPSVLVDDDGYNSLIRQEAKELITIPLNSTEVVVDNSQSITFTYSAAFEFITKEIHIRTTGEVNNFQLTVQKQVNGVFKTVRELVPTSLYEEGKGAFILDAMPTNPDPKATYFIRSGTDVAIAIQNASLVEVDENEDDIPYRMIWETTDPNGMQMSGVIADLGYGSQFYPYLLATGYDTTRLVVADRRDVFRKFKEVSVNETYTTKNDFFRNRHQLIRFVNSSTLTYATPDLWVEGDSLEVYCTNGKGTLVITGYTINGEPNLEIKQNRRYTVVLEDENFNNFVATQITNSVLPLGEEDLPEAVDFGPGAPYPVILTNWNDDFGDNQAVFSTYDGITVEHWVSVGVNLGTGDLDAWHPSGSYRQVLTSDQVNPNHFTVSGRVLNLTDTSNTAYVLNTETTYVDLLISDDIGKLEYNGTEIRFVNESGVTLQVFWSDSTGMVSSTGETTVLNGGNYTITYPMVGAVKRVDFAAVGDTTNTSRTFYSVYILTGASNTYIAANRSGSKLG